MARARKCPMPDKYLNKKLPHDTISFIDCGRNVVACKYCELVESNTRNIIFSKDNSHCGYVPYRLYGNVAKHELHVIYSFSVENGLISRGIPEVAYWPIYCSLTDKDRTIKDIIK
jgi:hypothetical protein